MLDFTKSGLRASVALKDGSDNIKAVVLPGVIYINSGEVVQRKHWIKLAGTLHTKTLKTAQAQILGGVARREPGHAGGILALGRRLHRPAPTTTIGGVKATEYDGTVPKAAFIAAFPVQARSAIKLTGDTQVPGLARRQGPADRRSTSSPPSATATRPTRRRYSAWGSRRRRSSSRPRATPSSGRF